jgi:hypothetical protein
MAQIEKFVPEDWQWAPFLDKNETMLLSGKPGGGKSFLAANKVHGFLLQYPNATWVVARKNRLDMDQSTIPLLLDSVIHIKHEPRVWYHTRADRVIYEHPDGQISELLFKGMHGRKQREGWKSIGMKGNPDGIWFEEATEFEEEDYDLADSRIRGSAADWEQFILSCNPDTRMHWINVRLIMGEEAAYYYSDWTMNSHIDREKYTRRMSRKRGIMRARLWDGRWTDGIGIVIDTWQDRYNEKSSPNPKVGNVTPDADYIPGGGPVVWVVDDGYSGHRDTKTGYFSAKSNPRAFLLAQKRPNDQLAIFDEHYDVKLLYDPHIRTVLEMCDKKGYPLPDYVLYDGASPTLGRYLDKHNLNSIPFRMKIAEGIEELRNWVGADENGVRRFIVHPRARNLRWEFVSYVYDSKKVDTPIDAFNHGIDGSRYLTSFISYGEPQPVDIAAPGVNMEEIEETVRRVMAEANQQSEKVIKEFLEKENSHDYSKIFRRA